MTEDAHACSIFVYEHLSAGGLLAGPPPDSLYGEGWAMLRSIVEDLAAIDGVTVRTMLDARLDRPPLPAETTRVDSPPPARRAFRRLATTCDRTLLIAPELAGILESLSAEVLDAGGRLFGTSPEALPAVTDKLALSRHLRRHGVPALECEPAATGATWGRPMVIKPRRGAGCEGVFLLASNTPLPPAGETCVATPWHEGIPASVLSIRGDDGIEHLLPCRQHVVRENGFRYLGGSLPLERDLEARALRLADEVHRALPRLLGFVGIDLLLGTAGATADVVVEVNPRPTTSYVGLRERARRNLSLSWLDAWQNGRPGEIDWSRESLAFSASGALMPTASHTEALE